MAHTEEASLTSGFVDAGIIVSSVSPARRRDDVLDSVLLAQLAAGKKFSRFEEAVGWYDFYTKTLGNLAWQITGLQHRQYDPPGSVFTLEEVVLDVLKRIVTDAQVNLVQETIRVFNRLPDEDPRVQIYEGFSLYSSIVDLQVSVSNSTPALSAVGVTLETKQEIKGLFKEELIVADLVGKIRTISYGGTLNEDAYDSLRESVITKLGPKRTELILDLDLP